jgi:hypothetical protein
MAPENPTPHPTAPSSGAEERGGSILERDTKILSNHIPKGEFQKKHLTGLDLYLNDYLDSLRSAQGCLQIDQLFRWWGLFSWKHIHTNTYRNSVYLFNWEKTWNKKWVNDNSNCTKYNIVLLSIWTFFIKELENSF